ncbi:hypothetical protein DPMN_148338 [Dreissena polymorpha]|uniref:Uncharacterized protein n=1 Tax=Dreissena polymorpha TaxID=45954 RepID=A0A9D4F9D4_DREPO|nr:hypothetical protein DPMN_148338 [Dreissena polymorpha]
MLDEKTSLSLCKVREKWRGNGAAVMTVQLKSKCVLVFHTNFIPHQWQRDIVLTLSVCQSLHPCVTNLLVIAVDINSTNSLVIPRQRQKDIILALFVHPSELTCSVQPKFHEDPPCGHVFQQTRTILKLIQDIIKTNLTKFHEDWTINVTLRVKNFLPTGSHFHEDQTINVAFTVLTSQPKPSFLLIQDIKYSEKFHEDWTINVTFGPYMYYEKCPNPGGHVFQPTRTIFELVQDIIGTILLTKVHKDRTINVASRPNGCHVFQPTRHIIEFAQVIIRTNLLTKFHGDRTINVTSKV